MPHLKPTYLYKRPQGFTAIESLVLLLLITMLALTSLAVYRKKAAKAIETEEKDTSLQSTMQSQDSTLESMAHQPQSLAPTDKNLKAP